MILAIVRLKEIGPKIWVEYITLKQSDVIKIISALVVRVVNWKHVVLDLIPIRILRVKETHLVLGLGNRV